MGAGRKLKSHRIRQRWADKAYKKSHLGNEWKKPFAGSSHAKGIDEMLIAGFGRKGHAVGDIPGVRFKIVKKTPKGPKRLQGRDPQLGDDSTPDPYGPYPQLRFSSPITDFEIISFSELNGCKIHGLAALQLEQGMGLKSSIVILEVSFMDEDAGVHVLSNVRHVNVERRSKRKPGEVAPVPDVFYGGYGVVEGTTLLEEEVVLAATEEEEMHE
ncbi:unnamed protein product [Fraxinus pennsylvanica]|uniref:Uncharacterized protein n=1 Tax=Fraxinus pennsylvanica TaxID=56036 RepID=A0AAD1ZZN5_9LAMI|nr:unnamed protein product [Fraxinus pennsylvanica]